MRIWIRESEAAFVADGKPPVNNHEWDGHTAAASSERAAKLLTAVPQVEKKTIGHTLDRGIDDDQSHLKARYSYPLFSRNQRGYLYVWMRDARYALWHEC